MLSHRSWPGLTCSIGLVLALAGCLGDLESRTSLEAKVKAQAPDAALADLAAGVDIATDSAVQDVLATDASPTDTQAVDANAGCPGAAGCHCASNPECGSGACLETGEGLQCAVLCGAGGSCGNGETCVTVGGVSAGGVAVKACAKKNAVLCDPCKASKACSTAASGGGACVDLGAQGAYCGIACALATDCPSDYECLDVKTLEGQATRQCVRKPDAASPGQPGACPCSYVATLKQATTACTVEAKDAGGQIIGKCTGERSCGVGGLSLCDAPTPTAETCDGKDNDCDKLVDEDSCGDGNPCTQDACLLPAGCTHTNLDGGACTDAKPCTVADACKAGKCAGIAKICDSTPCLDGACDVSDGGCGYKPKAEGTLCDDGNKCATGGTCQKSVCAGKTIVCDDTNPCTNDACDNASGCVHVPNNAQCNDGSACTLSDECKGGACVGVANTASCNDNNPCTIDACGAKGCTHDAAVGGCDDGNPCSTGDSCVGGLCTPGQNSCTCSSNTDCVNDADKCNGTVFCDKSTPQFACKVDPASVVKCAPSLDTPCLVASCNPATGTCATSPAANGIACDDKNVCTQGDACAGGQCVAGKPVDCNDGNSCTNDACDPAGGCQNLANSAKCEDGSLCTANDVCKQGKCTAGVATVCPTAICMKGLCDSATGQCSLTAVAGTCTDSNPCTQGDQCANGVCTGTPIGCDDNNKCTADSCANGGCVNALNCDDGNACTNDLCASPVQGCAHTATCDDQDPCTADSCDAGQCSFAAKTCPTGQVCGAAGACGSVWASSIGAGGAHSCAQVNPSFGSVLACWGKNDNGQLGTSKTVSSNKPLPVKLTGTGGAIESLDGGAQQTCALIKGVASCWGANDVGQCGTGSNTGNDVLVPSSVSLPSSGVVPAMISSGGTHGCLVSTANSAYCWGDNLHGQLGQGLTVGTLLGSYSTSAVVVTKVSNVKQLSAGEQHTCAVTGNGQVWCWGANKDGQSGQAGTADVTTPALVANVAVPLPVPLPPGLVAAGGMHTCVLGSRNGNAGIVCWGANDDGQLGIDAQVSSNVIKLNATLTQLTAGFAHTCARTSSGAIWCWGAGKAGQLGNAGNQDSATPVQVKMPAKAGTYVVSIAAGGQHTCALRSDGTVWCWGSNGSGQAGIGNKDPAQSSVPLQVFGSSPF